MIITMLYVNSISVKTIKLHMWNKNALPLTIQKLCPRLKIYDWQKDGQTINFAKAGDNENMYKCFMELSIMIDFGG